MTTLKLGKLPARAPKLRLATYTTPLLPPPPEQAGDASKFDGQMFLNDQLGDCAIAGPAHETLHWCALAGKTATITDANVLSAYEAVTGYDPRDPSSDQGSVVADVVKYRRTIGFPDATGTRHKIYAGLGLPKGDATSLKQSINLFDAGGIGFEVPHYAMAQFEAGKPWDIQRGVSTIDGGHYVAGLAYDPDYVYVATWGQIQRMTWRFYKKFADEGWAYLSPDFLNASGLSPDGFDYATLQSDVTKLAA